LGISGDERHPCRSLDVASRGRGQRGWSWRRRDAWDNWNWSLIKSLGLDDRSCWSWNLLESLGLDDRSCWSWNLLESLGLEDRSCWSWNFLESLGLENRRSRSLEFWEWCGKGKSLRDFGDIPSGDPGQKAIDQLQPEHDAVSRNAKVSGQLPQLAETHGRK
jgi:hypothetical protein